MNDFFREFAQRVSEAAGSSWTFLIAFMTIVVWAVSGPLFHFSETWQLVINTGTTIVTFLMVFLVQNTQNRDAKAMQLKLDELIHAQKRAHNKLMGAEGHSDKKLKKEKKEVAREK
jgi:low affinity Fe/Cu permease